MANVSEILSQILYFLTPIALVSLIFIFLIFKPQHKKITAHKKFIDELRGGDEVVTYGGIVGVITEVNDDIVYLEINNGSTIRIVKNNIMEKYKK
jgi:preprotein translocase subunit YajC